MTTSHDTAGATTLRLPDEPGAVATTELTVWTLALREARPSRSGALPPEHVLAAARSGVPARAPGNAHDALVAAGLVEDPYRNDGTAAAAWIGESDWVYRTRIGLPADPAGADAAALRHELVLTRVETVARVLVDGVVVAELASANRTHRIDVGPHLRPGGSDLAIEIDSAARAMDAAEAADPGGQLPYDWEHQYNRLRVTACSAGWDWAPPMITAGIGRAELVSWRGARLRTRTRTEVAEDLREGTLVVEVALDAATGDGAASGSVEVRLGELTWRADVEGSATLRLPVELTDADLWWPRGYGRATLHDVGVTLVGSPQLHAGRVGFRHAHLDTTPDEHGRACTVVVNGRPVFARGANWIPDDQLAARVTPERYRERVAQAVEANMTMLRVWGGGRYEDDLFYDLADEGGLLVWQDFAFACAAYPEEEPLRSEVVAEATEQVRRLAAHPSVVVWNGGNECLLGWEDWGWQARVAGRTWGDGYYHHLLPAIVAEHAPGVPYVPSSPFSSGPDVAANVDGDGSTHLWDQWNLRDHSTYRDQVPRFAAELGYQAPATWATLAGAIDAWPVAPTSAAMATRQRQPTGMRSLLGRLAGNVPDPAALEADLDDWLWATQLLQADAMRTAAEHLRGHWPRSAGMLVWQMNDAWPGISWSIVDHGGRRKPVWYALRTAFAPRALSIQPREGAPHVVLVNDTDDAWSTEVLVRRVHVHEGEVERVVLPASVAARGVAWLPVPPAVALPRRRREEILVADLSEADDAAPSGPPHPSPRRATAPLCRPDGVAWPDAASGASVDVEPVDGGWLVRVRARVVLADVAVLADRVVPEAVADDMLRTVLPGETLELLVTASSGSASGTVDSGALGRAPVLRTRNDLWHR